MSRKYIIESDEAPEAIGPYSQAVLYGELLFISGQIPIDPETGDLLDGDVEQQTTRVMENLEAVLNEAGLGFGHVLQTSMYLDDMDDYDAVNSIYAEYFGENPPARKAVEVSRLPKDVSIEISLIAAAPEPEETSAPEE
jgi:2-iminobutanoate/2-iminopropanoate deaminase